MGFKTLIIRNSEKLNLYLDNIIVQTNGGELRFLISDLKCLIIDNNKINLSVQLINKLTENNVSLIICNLSHLPTTTILPLSSHYSASGNINKQIAWNIDIKQKIHKKIVQAKIQSQINILIKNNRSKDIINRLHGFKNEVLDGDVGNREGLAAKMYFKELFGKDFIRFEDDIINAGLNYGYAIFRSLISSIVISKGLLTNIGLFHKGSSNNFNLCDDIIEVYRPIVDDYVFNNLINKELLTKDDKDGLVRLLDRKILMNNQLFLINNTIEMYLESIIKCFNENDDSYFVSPSLEKMIDL